MNILFVTHYSELYGANRSLLDLIDDLEMFNITPYILLPEKGGLIDELNKRGIQYAIIPFKVSVEYRWNSKNKFFQTLRDLEHLFKALKKYFINKILTSKCLDICKKWDIDLIYSNSSVITFGIDIANILKLPHFLHVRELIIKQFSLYPDFGLSNYSKKILKSNKIIYISKFVKDNFITKVESSKYEIIYNKVKIDNTNVSITSNKIRKKGGDFTFIIIGYLSLQKNQIEALEAMSKIMYEFPKTKLIVVGGGDLNLYQSYCVTLGITDMVEFVGFQNNVSKYYEISDAVLVCSINEALGRITIEAMMHKKPVIGKNSGGVAELLVHNKTGLLYNGVSDLAEQMTLLIKNPFLRDKIAKTGYETAIEKFSTENTTKKISVLLRSSHNSTP